MRLDVAFLPRLLRRPESSVCLLIDVLRASSSIVTLFARGAEEVVVAGSTAAARRIAAAEPGRYLLCGEVFGLAPPGFDYGNSPSEFAELDMRGRRIILSTTNGTKALRRLAASPVVIVGALLNATAAVRDPPRRGALARPRRRARLLRPGSGKRLQPGGRLRRRRARRERQSSRRDGQAATSTSATRRWPPAASTSPTRATPSPASARPSTAAR